MGQDFRSGFVGVLGRPNVGKSTLINRFCGEKVSIVTSKPQTTRGAIRAIFTDENAQIVFVDTPGLHKPAHRLGNLMNAAAESSLADADVCLFLVAPKIPSLDDLSAMERVRGRCVMLVINKSDTVQRPNLLPIIDAYSKKRDFSEVFCVSALKGTGCAELFSAIRENMPVGPRYYPDSQITDQTEREIVAELIRERALLALNEEVPHGLAVEIAGHKQREGKPIIDIDANLYCERSSHKGIIIGKGGAMLKRIGSEARPAIERFLGSQVNLTLWVKVKEGWRDNDFLLRSFGFRKQ